MLLSLSFTSKGFFFLSYGYPVCLSLFYICCSLDVQHNLTHVSSSGPQRERHKCFAQQAEAQSKREVEDVTVICSVAQFLGASHSVDI